MHVIYCASKLKNAEQRAHILLESQSIMYTNAKIRYKRNKKIIYILGFQVEACWQVLTHSERKLSYRIYTHMIYTYAYIYICILCTPIYAYTNTLTHAPGFPIERCRKARTHFERTPIYFPLRSLFDKEPLGHTKDDLNGLGNWIHLGERRTVRPLDRAQKVFCCQKVLGGRRHRACVNKVSGGYDE